MNTCGTCKYRGEQITQYDDEKFEEVPTGYFACGLIQHAGLSRDLLPGKTAAVIDGSGYYAALCVENDFGCVKWELAAQIPTQPVEAKSTKTP